jgi:hypothetical protein
LDLPPGGLWPIDLSKRLQETKAGILCITKDNTGSPWLNFEAGALARSVEGALIIPYAIDLDPSSIPNPIGHFQGVAATRRDTRRMITRLFEALPVDFDRKSKIFDVFWGYLHKVITSAVAVDAFDPNAIEPEVKAIEDISIAQRSTELKTVLVSPEVVRRGETLELEYVIETEAQDVPVWLGAAICLAEGAWCPQPEQDKEITLQLGVRRHRRQLSVPETVPVGDYHVNAEVWIGPKSDSEKSYAIRRTRRWPVRTIRVE